MTSVDIWRIIVTQLGVRANTATTPCWRRKLDRSFVYHELDKKPVWRRVIVPTTIKQSVYLSAPSDTTTATVIQHKCNVLREWCKCTCLEFPRFGQWRIVKRIGTERFFVMEQAKCRKNWNSRLRMTKIEYSVTWAVGKNEQVTSICWQCVMQHKHQFIPQVSATNVAMCTIITCPGSLPEKCNHGAVLNLSPLDHESDALTTTPPSHTLLFDQYQIKLLWQTRTCEQLAHSHYLRVALLAVKPKTTQLQVRCLNHQTKHWQHLLNINKKANMEQILLLIKPNWNKVLRHNSK